jgi:hypothetical protein
MPGTVKAAAIIWIVVGALGALGQLLSLGAGGFRPQSIVHLAIAVAFIVAGVQTISGKAKDTLGNGIARSCSACSTAASWRGSRATSAARWSALRCCSARRSSSG